MSSPSTEAHSEPPESLRFPRGHRLKRRRLIRPLFDRRRTDVSTVAAGCVRLVYRMVARAEVGRDVPLQIGFAPGRRVKNAVERNRVRRVLREAYRTRQHVLRGALPPASEGRFDRVLTVMVIFRGDPRLVAEKAPRDLPKAMREVAASL